MGTVHASGICFALSLAGCGGSALNIGSADGGSASGGPTGPVWNGTIENAQLQDGSNRLTMTVTVAANGSASGTLLLGDGALLQPATDPDIGYPPGVQFFLPGAPPGFFEGFAYPIRAGKETGSTLTFRVSEFDLWELWCGLETTTYVQAGIEADDGGGPVYSCVPNASFSGGPMGCSFTDPATGQSMPVDCGKFELCTNIGFSPCDCTAKGCREKSTTNQVYLDLNLVVAGAKADGTMSGWLGEHTVHFVRAP